MAKSVKTLSVYVNLKTKDFTTGLGRLQRSLKKFGNNLKATGQRLTSSITMPLALAGGGAVKLATDFETSMTKIQTLVGTSAEDVDKLRQSVLDLSGETAQSPKDLADALFFIQSAGFKGQESLDILKVSAQGAAMGMGELTDIANASTSIMRGYAKEGMTATMATDLLHETLKQGKFEAAEFMNKIGQVIPTAASFGISFEQLGASVATMSKLSGDAAGSLTAVNQLMLQLNKPAGEQLEILEDLFGSYDVLNKELKANFMGTLQKIFIGLEGNDLQLTKVFGSARAVKAAFATAGLQAEVYAEVLDGMNESAGNVAEGFAVVSEKSLFKFNKALAELRVAAIELGAILLPLFTKIADIVADLASRFTNLSSKGKNSVLMIVAALALLGPSLTILGTLVTTISTLIGVFKTLTITLAPVLLLTLKWVAILAAVWFSINSIIKIFKDIWDTGKFAINSLVTLFGSLGDVITNLFNPEKRREAMDKMFAELEKGWTDFKSDKVENLQETMDTIVSPVTGIIDKGKEWGSKFIENFKNGVESVSGNIGDWMGGLGGKTSATEGEGIKKVEPSLFPSSEFQIVVPPPLTEKATEAMNQWSKETIEKFNQTFDSMSEAVDNFAVNYTEAFADMLSTTIVEGGNIARAFQDFAKQMIADFVKLIIKTLIFQALMALITGGSGNVASGILSGGGGGGNILGSLFGFAEGGLVTGPTPVLVGEGRGISMSNPEVIAPLDKLKNYIGGGSGRLHGRISGSDILLSNSRSTINQNRVGGSVTNF